MAAEGTRESLYESDQQFQDRMAEPKPSEDDEEHIERGYNRSAILAQGILEKVYPKAEQTPSVMADKALDLRRAADMRQVANVGEPGERADRAAGQFVTSLISKVQTAGITIKGMGMVEKATVLGAVLLEEVRAQSGEVSVEELQFQLENAKNEIYILRRVLEPGDQEVIEALEHKDAERDAQLDDLRRQLAQAQLDLEVARINATPEGVSARLKKVRKLASSVFHVGNVSALLHGTM